MEFNDRLLLASMAIVTKGIVLTGSEDLEKRLLTLDRERYMATGDRASLTMGLARLTAFGL